jgi:hypothetical protein
VAKPKLMRLEELGTWCVLKVRAARLQSMGSWLSMYSDVMLWRAGKAMLLYCCVSRLGE